LGRGKEGEKCLIKNCADSNLFPSPLCLGHTAGALDYLENYGKQERTKKWVKEQKIRHQLAEYADEITRILEIIRAGEAELETLRPETGTQLQVGEIFQETHAEFLYFDKQGGIFSFKTAKVTIFSKQKIPEKKPSNFEKNWNF